MKIYNEVILKLDENRNKFDTIYEDSFDYDGVLDLVLGAGEETATPTVNIAGEYPQQVIVGSTVMIDGSQSTPLPGQGTFYLWTQQSGTNVIISNPGSPIVSFVAPSDPSNLLFKLKINNQFGMDTSLVQINVVQDGQSDEQLPYNLSGTTSNSMGHAHTYTIDENGNGWTNLGGGESDTGDSGAS